MKSVVVTHRIAQTYLKLAEIQESGMARYIFIGPTVTHNSNRLHGEENNKCLANLPVKISNIGEKNIQHLYTPARCSSSMRISSASLKILNLDSSIAPMTLPEIIIKSDLSHRIAKPGPGKGCRQTDSSSKLDQNCELSNSEPKPKAIPSSRTSSLKSSLGNV